MTSMTMIVLGVLSGLGLAGIINGLVWSVCMLGAKQTPGWDGLAFAGAGFFIAKIVTIVCCVMGIFRGFLIGSGASMSSYDYQKVYGMSFLAFLAVMMMILSIFFPNSLFFDHHFIWGF